MLSKNHFNSIDQFNLTRYDTKKSVWIMDAKTHAYKEGLLESGDIASLGAEGADLTVKMVVAVGHEKFT